MKKQIIFQDDYDEFKLNFWSNGKVTTVINSSVFSSRFFYFLLNPFLILRWKLNDGKVFIQYSLATRVIFKVWSILNKEFKEEWLGWKEISQWMEVDDPTTHDIKKAYDEYANDTIEQQILDVR